MDTKTVTGIVSHPAGYIDNAHREKETIVGLQTDKPLKRALHVNGGIRIACQAASQHGYKVDENVVERYTFERKTHNAGVFDVYTPEMRACRSAHIITGLPDGYGRGRIIGDYRRVALYGVDYLIKDKEAQKASTPTVMTADNIRDREELQEQIRALGELKMMAETYGFDISNPATNTQEAIQWMYFAYLAAVKEQNGAAMSIGRTSTFIDIYAERDLANGTFTEEQIQEFVDHFIMKLRMVKFARTPEYQALFTGDPQWVTESIGGMGVDGRTLVTKMSYRYLHTLENMGTSPEPNMTVLWSTRLPENFKKFCAKTSVASSSIQYENDDLMRVYHATTTVSPAACPPCALARRCSSSALAPTWLSACCMHSTAVLTRSPRSRSPQVPRRRGRYARLRRRCGQVQRHDEVARRRVRQLAEHHSLHARQVLLRAHPDGSA